MTRKDGGGYVAISLYPRTLDELRTLGRDFGDAAVAEARWVAISSWLMNVYPGTDVLRNPFAVANTCIHMAQEHDRYHLGHPCHRGREADRARPVLDGLSLDCKRHAELVTAETVADWEAAGSPYLDAAKLKSAYQYLVSCPAFIARYIDTNQQENHDPS